MTQTPPLGQSVLLLQESFFNFELDSPIWSINVLNTGTDGKCLPFARHSVNWVLAQSYSAL